MKLIVGLGNPGIEYQFTPHNLGFLAIEEIAERSGARVSNRFCRALTARTSLEGQEVVLAKPETYMNLSGVSVRELVEKLEIAPEKDLIILYDELDLPFGTLRIRERGRSAGHNGMESIIGSLGTQEFVRVRLGVGPGHPLSDGASYLLAPMKKSRLAEAVPMIETAADAIGVILKEGASVAMNRFNRKPEDESQKS
ncbi:MAG: aminoacyl-tRNA hydrolase [Terriglobia bacterium]|nr:aminoacyl-tRNA hydrolase [Terriglobia bacterium]